MADLDPCVRSILCALAAPVRSAVVSIITITKGLVQAQLVTISASLAILDITLLPIQALQALAQTAVDTVRGTVALVPTTLMAGCADLGTFMQGLNLSIDATVADLETVIDKANRYLSVRDDLQAQVDKLNAVLLVFDGIEAAIASC